MQTPTITPTPWEARIEDNKYIHIASSLAHVSHVTASVYCDPLDDLAKADAEAIVKAVNGTYGAGINPESVEMLKDVAEHIIRMISLAPEIESSFPSLVKKAKAALEKSKL